MNEQPTNVPTAQSLPPSKDKSLRLLVCLSCAEFKESVGKNYTNYGGQEWGES